MDISIHLPEQLTEEARQASIQLGLTFDELLAAALAAYLNAHQENITAMLDEIYQNDESALDPVLALIQTTSLEKDKW